MVEETVEKKELFSWKIYDCDEEVVNDVIAISRLYFKNRGVDFLRWAVAQFKARDNPNDIEEMFGAIMLELEKLKQNNAPVEKAEEGVKTFGGMV